MEDLYQRICYFCQQQGIRPGKLCAQLGLSRSLITDLKMGRKKSVNAETAQKISAYFGISVGQLLGQEACPAAQKSNDLLDEVDVAFYGNFKALDEAQKEAVREMVQVMREKRKEKQGI